MTTKPNIAVIGGGLAGLTAAAYVARAGHGVTVYETRNRLGGRATTDEHQGFRLNQGPHALYLGGAAEQVLSELGIDPKGGRPPVKGAMWRDGTLYTAPAGLGTLLRTRLFGLRAKAEFGALLVRLPKLDPTDYADLTVRQWAESETDRAEIVDVLLALARLATYVNAPDDLSADAAITQLQLAVGSGVRYIDGGWATIVTALRDRPGIEVVIGAPVDELPEADAVIVANGSPEAAAKLIGCAFAIGPPAETAVLDLGVSVPPACDFAIGIDQPYYCSNHSRAAALAPSGQHLVSVAKYLSTGESASKYELMAFARAAGISEDAVVYQRYLHRMAAVTAIPVAELGGFRGRPTVEVSDQPAIFVAGDWVGPQGHLADAVFASARQAARLAMARLQ